MYNGTPLIRSPRGQKKLTFLTGDLVSEGFLQENVWLFYRAARYGTVQVRYIFIAPYSPKGGIGLVTIKVFMTTINYLKYKWKQQNYAACTISIITIL